MLCVPRIDDAMVHHVSISPAADETSYFKGWKMPILVKPLLASHLYQECSLLSQDTRAWSVEHFRSYHRGRGRVAFTFATCQDRLKTFKRDPAEDYRPISGVFSENLKHFWGSWAFLEKQQNNCCHEATAQICFLGVFLHHRQGLLSAWGDNQISKESTLSVTVIVSTWSSFACVNWTFSQLFADMLISH